METKKEFEELERAMINALNMCYTLARLIKR